MAGYIYPELLDHVEYKVNYGSSPSISRADRKAVTVGNDICNCTEELDGLKDEIYAQICDAYILKYKPGEDFGIDDVEITEDFVNEES